MNRRNFFRKSTGLTIRAIAASRIKLPKAMSAPLPELNLRPSMHSDEISKYNAKIVGYAVEDIQEDQYGWILLDQSDHRIGKMNNG